MQTGKPHIQKQPNDPASSQGPGRDIIAEIYKALKAETFYPANHPLRNGIIRQTYQLLLTSMKDKDLSLLITKDGIYSAEGGSALENSLAAKSLAKELFVREIQRLSFFPGLSIGEFEKFLSLLTTDPQKIISDGGMEKILPDRGISNIVTNEIDISTVFTKKTVSEGQTGEPGQETEILHESRVTFDFLPDEETEDMEIEDIIEAMKIESDDERYAGLARLLLSKSRALKTRSEFKELLPIIRFLIDQSADTSKSRTRRDCARAAFEGAAEGEMAAYLLDCLTDRHYKPKEGVCQILVRLGEKAVEPTIQRLNSSDNIHSRKALATLLARIGTPGVPALVSHLNDHRWYVVRGMLFILGEIRCRECTEKIRPTLLHEDVRVVKEAIRCLTKTGGPEAVEMLIELLADQNPSIKAQAIFSLGILKSDVAVEPLMDIVTKRDLFLKTLHLKKECLQSIGLIGSKKALPGLMKMAGRRRLFATRRRNDLTAAMIKAISRIGGDTSLAFLLSMAARGGAVGRACREEFEKMGRK